MSFVSKGQLSLEKVKAENYKSNISSKDQHFLTGFKPEPTWCYICHHNIWSGHFKSNASCYDRWHAAVKKPVLKCRLTERVVVDKTEVYSNQLKCNLLCIVSTERIKSEIGYSSVSLMGKNYCFSLFKVANTLPTLSDRHSSDLHQANVLRQMWSHFKWRWVNSQSLFPTCNTHKCQRQLIKSDVIHRARQQYSNWAGTQ